MKTLAIILIVLFVVLILITSLLVAKIDQSRIALQSISGQVAKKIDQVDRFIKDGENKLNGLNIQIETIAGILRERK